MPITMKQEPINEKQNIGPAS